MSPRGVRCGEGLGRGERIVQSREYRQIQREGRRRVGRHVILLVQRGTQAWTRIGLTVSRKVGNAVTRNRVKRRLREIYRRHKSVFPAASDVVLIAKASAATASYASLETEVLGLCRSLREPGRPRSR